MDRLRIYHLFECLKIKPFGETRTKIDVINGQLMYLHQDQQLVDASNLD